jgi:hypothetical protein
MSAVNEQEIRTRSIGYKKRKPQQIGQKFLFLFSKRNAFCSFFVTSEVRKLGRNEKVKGLRRLGPEAPDPHFLESIYFDGVSDIIGGPSMTAS